MMRSGKSFLINCFITLFEKEPLSWTAAAKILQYLIKCQVITFLTYSLECKCLMDSALNVQAEVVFLREG